MFNVFVIFLFFNYFCHFLSTKFQCLFRHCQVTSLSFKIKYLVNLVISIIFITLMTRCHFIFWNCSFQWSVKPFKAYSKPTVLSFSILQASNSNKLPNYPLHIANPRSMCYLQHILTGCVTLMHIDQVITYPCVLIFIPVTALHAMTFVAMTTQNGWHCDIWVLLHFHECLIECFRKIYLL